MTTAWLCLLLTAASAHAATADLILRGGKVFLEPGRYVSALAVQGNRVLAVGSDQAIDALRGPKTRVIELQGRAAVPGFHDGHARVLDGGLSIDQADLSAAKSFEDVQKTVSDFAAAHPADEWVLGFGWKPAALGRLPAAADLDAAVKGRPVALASQDGDMMWLNAEAIKRAHVEHGMVLKRGGKVVRDEKGRPTGLLVGDAVELATRAFPKPDEKKELSALRAALALARREGVTSFDAFPDRAAGSADFLALWSKLALAGEATARVALYGDLEDLEKFAKLKKPAEALPRTRLLLAGAFLPIDGRLLEHDAALLAAYTDEPKNWGDTRHSRRWLAKRLREAHRAQLQGGVEARGDKGVRTALDACGDAEEDAKDTGLVLPRYPCRVELADMIDPEDVPRFSPLRAAVSAQPPALARLAEQADPLTRLLGGRTSYLMPWRSLEQGGALLVLGSGWPDGPLSPLLSIADATQRALVPEQRLTFESALRHYTADPARAVGMGDQLGELRPGRLADVVILDRDVFADDGKTIGSAAVDVTVFDGKVVFERAAR